MGIESNVVPWLIIGVVVAAGLGAAVGHYVGSQKGRPDAGMWLGMFFGVSGWIVAGLLEPTDEERLRRARLLQGLTAPAVADPLRRSSGPSELLVDEMARSSTPLARSEPLVELPQQEEWVPEEKPFLAKYFAEIVILSCVALLIVLVVAFPR